MKIVLFRGGRRGVAAELPGDFPERELTDLLGGGITVDRLNERLALVRLGWGEREELPVRYTLHRLGYRPEEFEGDAVVIGLMPDSDFRDVDSNDVEAANTYLRPLDRAQGEERGR